MGLITVTVPLGGMYVAPTSLPIVTPPYVLTANSSSDVYSDINAFDDSIYRILSMQDDMKTVSIQGQVSNEFELFLKYAEDLTAGLPVGANFVAFNNYLGTIGV